MNDFGTDRWQLPDGVNELLPAATARVEQLRRRIIDRCQAWGFDFVMPPLIEYIDSLLTGTGETLDLQTFKLVDQNNGRTLGIRADMTPQVARIDAHAMRCELPNRLFYTGSVVKARSDGAGGSRTPFQFGAELFGHAGEASDIEIIRLMLDTILLADIKPQDLLLDLGHVGVFAALADASNLAPAIVDSIFAALQTGSVPELEALLAPIDNNPATRCLAKLPTLRGDAAVIEKARTDLELTSGVSSALSRLDKVIAAIQQTHPDVNIHVDLSELRGYRYHTGMLFGLYDMAGKELARGGRYDDIGEAFGRSRPATGFSGDLVRLAESGADSGAASADATVVTGIFVEASAATDAWSTIKSLRDAGERVVVALPGSGESAQLSACNRTLVKLDDRWTVQSITPL